MKRAEDTLEPTPEADIREPELLADPKVRRLGAVLWPSFFTACVMTLVFFALVDPLELDAISALHLGVGRMAGYSIGFAMFWVATASSSAFTVLLARREREP